MEKEKYKRNLLLEDIKEHEKIKLLQSKILIAGCGALGSKVLANLAAAGIGTIGLIDNIADYKMKRIISAQNWLRKNYKNIIIRAYDLELGKTGNTDIISNYDILMDCFDNYQSKFLLNEYAVKHNIPMVHGETGKSYGHATVIIPHETPCLACIFPNIKQDTKFADETTGFAANAIGALMSQSAINLLLGIKDDLENVLLTYNADSMKLEKIKLSYNQECKICAHQSVVSR